METAGQKDRWESRIEAVGHRAPAAPVRVSLAIAATLSLIATYDACTSSSFGGLIALEYAAILVPLWAGVWFDYSAAKSVRVWRKLVVVHAQVVHSRPSHVPPPPRIHTRRAA
jgi:hypothetical protein